MCGIFGYLGDNDALKITIEGLKKLEYRGYDSAGIAAVQDRKIVFWKKAGKIHELENALPKIQLSNTIGHTRWATHGAPSEQNAHPHFDENQTIAVVHNGVIENYLYLKEKMKSERFVSETDTETIPHLLKRNDHGNFLQAALQTFSQLEGSFALAILHKEHPDMLIATAEHSPLVVGYCPDSRENFVASDPHALEMTNVDLYFLANREVAVLQKNAPPLFYDKEGVKITKEAAHLGPSFKGEKLQNFATHMESEIFEQEKILRDMLKRRIKENAVFFEEIQDPKIFSHFEHVLLIGCGTSFHAALHTSYLLEEMARLPAKAEIASEFIYKKPVILPNTLVIAMSQSGETADTLAAVQEAKRQGAFVLGICNVSASSLTRAADVTLLMQAGPEVAVASTKTFTAQLLLLTLFTLFLGRCRQVLSIQTERMLLKELTGMPTLVFQILSQAKIIQKLAKKYAIFNDFFFLGRVYQYPIALEAALKLREIAYIDATGYPAGEMKHGPIAFINASVPVFAFCADSQIQKKMMSNLMECNARNAPVIAFTWKAFADELKGICEDLLLIPQTIPQFAGIPFAIAAQLFSYYVAKERGSDIDQPRNLAKSVTVE